MNKYLAECVSLSRNPTCKKMHFTCEECIRLKLKIPSGTRLELCKAIHAEQMAILNAMKKGISVVGADLYVTGEYPDGRQYRKKHEGFYCTFCSRLIYYSGIKNIIVDTMNGAKRYTPEEGLKDSFDIAFGRKKVERRRDLIEKR